MSNAQTFIHLRVYSSYSLLESAVRISELVSKVQREEMPAVALTDKCNLFAALEFSMLASSKGIQPIIGCDFNFDPQIEECNVSHSKSSYRQDKILVIAKNPAGYQNLLKLSSQYYAKDSNAITFEQLKEFSSGLLVLTGGNTGTLARLLLQDKQELATEFLLKLNEIFFDHLYIEIMRVGERNENRIEPYLIEMALKHNIPLVATNDVYFLEKEMHEAHDILTCIADNKYVVDEDRRRVTSECYLKSVKEMQDLFSDIPEAIENTILIAQRCSVKAEEHATLFPEYQVTVGADEKEELRILASEGLKRRLNFLISLNSQDDADAREKIYWDRFNYEIDMIEKMGFVGYFLIVSDFIRWAKKQGIPVGPGRGSGAGSVISWSLDITDVDPIKFGLLFERFLNPERVSLPDLDIDFCQDRRDEVIRYVQEKYGKDKVAHIITFGKLQARAVVRDVGRVLMLPYSQVDMIAKMIPFNAVNPVTLEQAIEMEPGLSAARKEDPKIAKLLDISLKLEGLHRHASTHAAGIVISRNRLEEVVPLYKDSKTDIPVIQYSMKYAEAAGLIKFDFLGLKTLTVVDKCNTLIKTRHPDFDLASISLEDKKTFEMLSKGRSSGVFQFESLGMKDYLSKMKPDSIDDIIALGALYRPGPMDNIPSYINCKHGKETPNYIHPKLEAILSKTFGVAIYQEQVLEIARSLAGYTLGGADLLRRAMGKKIKSEMDAQREKFVKGSVDNGISKEQATEIFDLVAKFAGYGFNKAHAVAYGLISYQTAYLKANYPVEMLVSILNTEIDDTDKIGLFIEDAKYLGITIDLPDINLSEAYFSIDKNSGGIRYALGAIKNVGLQAMKLVCEERRVNGLYNSIDDFIKRVGDNILNKRQLEYLIKSGAFDSVSTNRKQIFESIDALIDCYNKYVEEKHSKQISLFGGIDDKENQGFVMKDFQDWDCEERLHHECSAIGFYLSGHPLDIYQDYFSKISVMNSSQIRNELPSGRHIAKIAGIPVVIKTKSSPRGRYIIMSLSTPTGMVDVTVFDDKILEKNRDIINSKTPLLVQAEVRKDGEMERVTANAISRLDAYLKNQKQTVCIEIDSLSALDSLKELVTETSESGASVVVVTKINLSNVMITLPSKYSCNLSKISLNNLPSGVVSIKQTI